MTAARFSTNPSAEKRNPLHSLCPYFAMFPESFVREQLKRFTKPGDLVLDPFCGRGTTVLESLLSGRNCLGIDVNPVAYCVSAAKAAPPQLAGVLRELRRLESLYLDSTEARWEERRSVLPPFFRRAFHAATLRELLFLRTTLDWKGKKVHRFIAALALGSLHGEMDKSSSYFSNQMPRSISTKPGYSLRYWRDHNLWPRRRRVFALLEERARLRLGAATSNLEGFVRLGDARMSDVLFADFKGQVQAVITSPPYLDITRYEEDQWLRLWFLGGPSAPAYGRISKDDRHGSKRRYWRFLTEAWIGLRVLLRANATLICRIGAKGLSLAELEAGLSTSLTDAGMGPKAIQPATKSKIRNRQTDYFLPDTNGCLYEIDFAFTVSP